MHSPHRIHSLSLTSFTSILQKRTQASQPVQTSASTRTPNTAIRLKNEYIAPKGQTKRQKGRYIKTEVSRKSASKRPVYERSKILKIFNSN